MDINNTYRNPTTLWDPHVCLEQRQYITITPQNNAVLVFLFQSIFPMPSSSNFNTSQWKCWSNHIPIRTRDIESEQRHSVSGCSFGTTIVNLFSDLKSEGDWVFFYSLRYLIFFCHARSLCHEHENLVNKGEWKLAFSTHLWNLPRVDSHIYLVEYVASSIDRMVRNFSVPLSLNNSINLFPE